MKIKGTEKKERTRTIFVFMSSINNTNRKQKFSHATNLTFPQQKQ